MKIYWNETSKFNVPGAKQGLPDSFNETNKVFDAKGNDLSEMLILGLDTETGEIEYFKKDSDGHFIANSSLENARFSRKFPAPLKYERQSKEQIEDTLEELEERPIWFVYWSKSLFGDIGYGLNEYNSKEKAEEFVDKLTTEDEEANYVLIEGKKLEEVNHDADNSECEFEE